MSSAPTSTVSASTCPISVPTWSIVPETVAPEQACCCSETVTALAFSVAIAASASAAAAWTERWHLLSFVTPLPYGPMPSDHCACLVGSPLIATSGAPSPEAAESPSEAITYDGLTTVMVVDVVYEMQQPV